MIGGEVNIDYIIVEVDASYSLLVERGDKIKLLSDFENLNKGEIYTVSEFSKDGKNIIIGGIDIPSRGYGRSYIVID